MSKSTLESVSAEVEKKVKPYAEKLNFELVDVEYLQDGGYWYVRIYIEKENHEENISLDDCAELSNKIEDIVDELIDEKFYLEVSSPGLERPLKKEKDFIRFSGKKIKILLKHKIADSRNYTGKLEKYENSKLYLNTGEDIVEIPFDEVKKSNLVFDFDEI